MKPDWTPLNTELDIWRDLDLSLPLWWRDDDAVSATPQLDRLTEMSEKLGLPVHLAVIPKTADASLAEQVRQHACLIPVVHGWAHHNHAPSDEKKSEFRLHRPLPEIESDLRNGLNRLTDLFKDRLRPIFVPPWNRIAPEVARKLTQAGFSILSTATPRDSRHPLPGLEQVNTHLDPIDWRGTRGLMPPEQLIATTVSLLQDRRAGRSDPTEPFGVLTHHLVHDENIWTFTYDLLHRLLDGPSTIWTAPDI